MTIPLSSFQTKPHPPTKMLDVSIPHSRIKEPEELFRGKIANIHLIIEKAREFQKTSTSALLTMPKPLTVWITTNCGKFLKRWEYQTTLPTFWEICLQVKKQQLEPDMEQHTGSKLGKECFKAVYCHLVYLISMQSTSWEMSGSMKHCWNQDCREKDQ